MDRFAPLAALIIAIGGAPGAAQELLLRPRADSPPARYTVEIDADYGGHLAGYGLVASYGVTHRSLSPSVEGIVPVVLVFDQCAAATHGPEGEAPLTWSLEGRGVVVLLGPDNVAREVLVPLPASGPAPAADALAAYAALLWSIPYPAEALTPGASFMVDVITEPSLAGPVLVHRRIVGGLASVDLLEGRQVAVLEAQAEQSMAPDHPTLAGSATMEIRVAVDVATGQVLGASLLETSEIGSLRDPGAPPVVMEPLRCTVRLEGGPNVDTLIALP